MNEMVRRYNLHSCVAFIPVCYRVIGNQYVASRDVRKLKRRILGLGSRNVGCLRHLQLFDKEVYHACVLIMNASPLLFVYCVVHFGGIIIFKATLSVLGSPTWLALLPGVWLRSTLQRQVFVWTWTCKGEDLIYKGGIRDDSHLLTRHSW